MKKKTTKKRSKKLTTNRATVNKETVKKPAAKSPDEDKIVKINIPDKNATSADPKTKVQPIAEKRVALLEFVRNTHVAEIPEGVSIETVLKPEFWAHAALKFKRWDHVELRAEDGAWWAEAIIMSVERVAARMVPIRFVELNMSIEQGMDLGEHEVIWKGPHRKYSVIRKSDNEYMSDGHDTRGQALQWLVDYQKRAVS